MQLTEPMDVVDWTIEKKMNKYEKILSKWPRPARWSGVPVAGLESHASATWDGDAAMLWV